MSSPPRKSDDVEKNLLLNVPDHPSFSISILQDNPELLESSSIGKKKIDYGEEKTAELLEKVRKSLCEITDKMTYEVVDNNDGNEEGENEAVYHDGKKGEGVGVEEENGEGEKGDGVEEGDELVFFESRKKCMLLLLGVIFCIKARFESDYTEVSIDLTSEFKVSCFKCDRLLLAPELMETACGHFFHQKCVMGVKDCPKCGRLFPPGKMPMAKRV